MTREEAKRLLPIIQAYAEGKEIEFHYDLQDPKCWKPTYDPEFICGPDRYRIAPEKPAPPLWSRPEHVPLGAWIRSLSRVNTRWLLVACDADMIAAGCGEQFAYSYLVHCEHSTDQGKTWKPCTVAEGSV